MTYVPFVSRNPACKACDFPKFLANRKPFLLLFCFAKISISSHELSVLPSSIYHTSYWYPEPSRALDIQRSNSPSDSDSLSSGITMDISIEDCAMPQKYEFDVYSGRERLTISPPISETTNPKKSPKMRPNALRMAGEENFFCISIMPSTCSTDISGLLCSISCF